MNRTVKLIGEWKRYEERCFYEFLMVGQERVAWIYQNGANNFEHRFSRKRFPTLAEAQADVERILRGK